MSPTFPRLPEHWHVAGALSPVQGSCPCSSKESTAGLEMGRPAHKKARVMLGCPGIHIQSFGQERNRIKRRAKLRKAYIMKNEVLTHGF